MNPTPGAIARISAGATDFHPVLLVSQIKAMGGNTRYRYFFKVPFDILLISFRFTLADDKQTISAMLAQSMNFVSLFNLRWYNSISLLRKSK